MTWHDYLALALVALAAAFVAARAYRALFGRAAAGCNTGCSSCNPSIPKSGSLVSISPPPDVQKIDHR